MSNAAKQRANEALRVALAKYVDRAIDVVVDIMDNEDVAPETRVKCAFGVMDRVAGKPSQEVIIDQVNPDEFEEQYQAAQEKTREVMKMLPSPSEHPLGEVVELRPAKRKVKRSR